jgi:hypothetical protein
LWLGEDREKFRWSEVRKGVKGSSEGCSWRGTQNAVVGRSVVVRGYNDRSERIVNAERGRSRCPRDDKTGGSVASVGRGRGRGRRSELVDLSHDGRSLFRATSLTEEGGRRVEREGGSGKRSNGGVESFRLSSLHRSCSDDPSTRRVHSSEVIVLLVHPRNRTTATLPSLLLLILVGISVALSSRNQRMSQPELKRGLDALEAFNAAFPRRDRRSSSGGDFPGVLGLDVRFEIGKGATERAREAGVMLSEKRTDAFVVKLQGKGEGALVSQEDNL